MVNRVGEPSEQPEISKLVPAVRDKLKPSWIAPLNAQTVGFPEQLTPPNVRLRRSSAPNHLLGAPQPAKLAVGYPVGMPGYAIARVANIVVIGVFTAHVCPESVEGHSSALTELDDALP